MLGTQRVVERRLDERCGGQNGDVQKSCLHMRVCLGIQGPGVPLPIDFLQDGPDEPPVKFTEEDGPEAPPSDNRVKSPLSEPDAPTSAGKQCANAEHRAPTQEPGGKNKTT